jgi:hypothetical protein
MANFISTFIEIVKNTFSMKEILLFLITIGLLTLLIIMFQTQSVHAEVSKSSRCIRERRIGKRGGVYSVEAQNEFNDPLYTVSYDLGAKKYDLKCACSPGNVANTFSNIKVYDMRNNKASIISSHTCHCDKFIEPSRVYYTGYNEIVRFMNNNDKSFFETANKIN